MMTNFWENYYFCIVLYFGLFWLFCYTNGYFLDIAIFMDSMALTRCMDFKSLGGLGFLKGWLTNFGGNFYFGDVLRFRLFWLDGHFMHFSDLESMVHGLLESC